MFGLSLQQHCMAYENGSQNLVPYKRKRRKSQPDMDICTLSNELDDAYLLERRPDKRLLAVCSDGLLRMVKNPDESPIVSEWKTYRTKIRHTFTHFHLEITPEPLSLISLQTQKRFFALEGEFNSNELRPFLKKLLTFIWRRKTTRPQPFHHEFVYVTGQSKPFYHPV